MRSKLLRGIIFFSLSLNLPATLLFADQQATTTDGRSVQLNDDGTWKYLKAEPPSTSEEFTFRKTRWGMTKAEVKSSEPTNVFNEETLSGGQELIQYKGRVGGVMPALVSYGFTQGKLIKADYFFMIKHSDKNAYITEYQNIKEILTKKYGAPVDEKEVWRNDQFKDNPQSWGFAIGVGHHFRWAKWVTPATMIKLYLVGDKFEINLSASYKSNSFSDTGKSKLEGF